MEKNNKIELKSTVITIEVCTDFSGDWKKALWEGRKVGTRN